MVFLFGFLTLLTLFFCCFGTFNTLFCCFGFFNPLFGCLGSFNPLGCFGSFILFFFFVVSHSHTTSVSDSGEGTNWGLYGRLLDKWQSIEEVERDPYGTIYRDSFCRPLPPGSLVLSRLATPKERSLKMGKVDRVNHDLPYNRTNQPELIWNVKKHQGLWEPRNPPIPLYD